MSEAANVEKHLEAAFAQRRIVFWHDFESSYAEEVDTLALPEGVTLLRINNDEFGLKHRMLRAEPEAKFLVYRPGEVPTGIDNWLLDLELAYGVFTADRTALLRADLGLTGAGIDDVLVEHATFFRSAKRTQTLAQLLRDDDTPDHVRAKMAAVLLGQTDHSLLELTRTLLIEAAAGRHTKLDLLTEYGLESFHWRGAANIYHYQPEAPSLPDFILWLFTRANESFVSERPGYYRNIQLDFESLRNNRRSADAILTLAGRAAADLSYATSIEDADLAELTPTDIFEETEQKILHLLVNGITHRTLADTDVAEVIRARHSSVWFDRYEDLYTAIETASELLTTVATASFECESFDQGLRAYRDRWFRIDQLYRHFQRAARQTEHDNLLEDLRAEVEKAYVNRFLFPLCASWQQQVDGITRWESKALAPQGEFYEDRVDALVAKHTKKAVVIVSDALRFEIADELKSRVRREDKFDATLDAMLGVLPSYTQLGMAALLPHRTLAHAADSDLVLVDAHPSDGTANRSKILSPVDGVAIQAEDVFSQTSAQLREFYSAHQVIYVYHNRIDAAGDNATTERQVFEAADEAVDELLRLIKKLTSGNATNIFVTADHGFLYQDSELADAAFLSERADGTEIIKANRRFILGRGLTPSPAFTTFTPEQLGLAGDIEVQIPKSLHRLVLRGAGTRYVHGGASLQEIVVPVLAVNKKRASDIRKVNVSILQQGNKITSGQLVVEIFQDDAVTDKVQPLVVRAGLWSGDQLLSNDPVLTFDNSSRNKTERYQKVQLVLSRDADDYNNKTVEFRLEEQISPTTQWRHYQSVQYQLRRSFTSDFDF